MRARAFTLIEGLLVLLLLAVLLAFVYPNFEPERRRRSLTESADRLRALIERCHAEAMLEGVRYRIQFPGTPDPNDPDAEDEFIEVPEETQQPEVYKQDKPWENPESYVLIEPDWMPALIMQPGTRCVSVLPGVPDFNLEEVDLSTPFVGPSIRPEEEAEYVPLTLNPDGTTEWVTFVLTNVPPDEDVMEEHIDNIVNLIVDGRTGDSWMQRVFRVDEVELMQEYGASPMFHLDFTRPEPITEANILSLPNVPTSAGSGEQREGY